MIVTSENSKAKASFLSCHAINNDDVGFRCWSHQLEVKRERDREGCWR